MRYVFKHVADTGEDVSMHERGRKIVFVGCVESGCFCAQYLINNGIVPDAIVSIDHAMAERNQVSGYCDLFSLNVDCEKYRPESYSMKNSTDIEYFRKREFAILVILGWQRLIPVEIINSLLICGLTIHGSGEGLPKGRGRSPMNWAIIEGFDKFHLSLLTLSAGADGGKILGTKTFDILSTDTIKTLYYKNAMVSSRLLAEHIPQLLSKGDYGKEQDESLATYYPKRTPEDGRIDWKKSAYEIERLVRAVTKPYPGAFTYCKGQKITVWQGQFFDSRIFSSTQPGSVIAVFPDSSFLVSTGDKDFLVLTYEGPCPHTGEKLE